MTDAGDAADADKRAAKLRGLLARVERVALEPDLVHAPFVRLMRPILARVGYEPRVRVERAQALLATLRQLDAGTLAVRDDGEKRDLLAQRAYAALAEFEHNVASVERACVVNRRAPVAYAAWLGRMHRVVARALDAAHAPDDALARRVAIGVEAVAVLPPLRPRVLEATAGDEHPVAPDASAARLLDLELGAVDHLIDAARAEAAVLARKRRLLEAARQMLLEVDAALPLEAAGVEARRAHVAAEIARIDRLEAAGLDPEVGLLHQARGALARGEFDRLNAALVALDAQARASGDGPTAAHTGDALRRLWRGADPYGERARLDSLDRSAQQLFGDDVLRAVDKGYDTARRHADKALHAVAPGDENYALRYHAYLVHGSERATLCAAVAADGCFELGGGVSPVRVVEHHERVRAVAYPTQELVLLPARDASELPDAVIDDPRSVLLSLAAGRLLARRYVAREHVTTSRVVLRGQVRVYVLDGSGSMLGPRARMRDAVLLAELATLRTRLEARGARDRIVVYYRFFNDALEPTVCVDSVAACTRAIERELGTVRAGGTNIDNALIASFAQVREAKERDPLLASAQIVLVTDGEAPVNEALVREAREAVGALPVGVSVIALGAENAALRAMVARERARGERAFYHFIDDPTLATIARGELDAGAALHLPRGTAGKSTPADVEALSSVLDELASLGRARDVEAMEGLDLEARSRREAGLDDAVSMTEGERARIEALNKDRRALEARFARWFPSIRTGGAKPAAADAPDGDDVDAVVAALAGVSEVIAVVGGTDLARRADAIEMLERVLPDAGLSPRRYEAVLAAHAPAVDRALQAVHDAARPSAS